MLMVLAVSAQEPQAVAIVLDAAEDTTHVTTIADIIEVQEMVNSRQSSDSHFTKVWSRTSFFNIGYNTSATLQPNQKEPVCAGLYESSPVEKYASSWGADITLGHNYRLHKKPIANIVQFNLDWTFININANHYDNDGGVKLYDSSLMWETTADNGTAVFYQYLPWNVEKYDVSYSMAIGPSVTLAPFTYVNVPALHFLKFNIYYHIGYGVSLLVFNADKKYDANPSVDSNIYATDESNFVMAWGHGLTSTFGLSMSWKSIGLGWETVTAKSGYQPLLKDTYGSEAYKFKTANSRIYLQIRY